MKNKNHEHKRVNDKCKNVLIIGNYGNNNIGDEILLKVAVLDLLDKYSEKNVKIYVPVRNPNFINIYHKDIPLNPFYVYDIKTLIKNLINTDEIIVGGGGLWHEYTGNLSKLIPIFLIASKILRKRVIIRSVGVYDTASKAEKLLVNLSFLFADQCSVRDNESFKNIWSINKKIKIEKDLALQLPDILKNGNINDNINGDMYQKYEDLLKKTSEYEIISQKKSQGKFIIGISLKPLNDIDKTKEIIEKISNFVNIINSEFAEKVNFVLFPFAQENLEVGKENDLVLFNDIINKIENRNNIIIASHMNPILWYLLIRLVDIFIGMRYHSIIFSFLNNKPFVAIPYANKVWNFLKENSCPNVLSLENFNEDYLIRFFKDNFVENNRRIDIN